MTKHSTLANERTLQEKTAHYLVNYANGMVGIVVGLIPANTIQKNKKHETEVHDKTGY